MEHNNVPALPPEAVDPNVDGPRSHQPTLEDPTTTWVQHLFVPDAPSVPPGVPASLLLPSSLPHPTELELAEADVRRLQTALAAAQNRLNGLRRLSGQGEAAQQCQPTSSPQCCYCRQASNRVSGGWVCRGNKADQPWRVGLEFSTPPTHPTVEKQSASSPASVVYL